MNKRGIVVSFIILIFFVTIFNTVSVSAETESKEINVLTFNQLNLSKSYSELDRAIAYSGFFMMCERYQGQCNLKQNEFDSICSDLSQIEAPNGDCYVFYKLYQSNETHKIIVSEELASQYNLIKSLEEKGGKTIIWWILIPSVLVALICILIFKKRKK